MSRFRAAAFAALVPPAALAQEPVELAPLVLSGGLTPIEAEAYGRAHSVVTRQELEDRQITYVSEALRALPGVSVTRTGAPGGVTQVRLRGAEGNHTLVLVDGVEVSAPENGEYDFGGLLAADIARIEVLRGPQSALYGANALGGVISITTRRAERRGLTVGGSAEAGTDGTGAAHAYLRGLGERGSFSLSVARRESEGFDISDTPGGEEDGQRNLTVNARGEWFATDALTLGGSLRVSDRQADTDAFNFGAPTRDELVTDDPSGRRRLEAFGSVYAIAEHGRFRHEARAGYLYADPRNTLSGDEITDTTSERATASLRSTVALDAPSLAAAAHSLTALAEYQRESFQNDDPDLVFDPSQLKEQSRELVGFAAEYRGTLFEALDLQLGARHDFNDAFEDATTWSAGASWRIEGTGMRLHASAGRAVVNPTLFEQFGFVPGDFVGNPDLEPEESFGWDVGVEQTFWDGRAVIDVTYFQQDLEKEISVAYPAPDFLGTPVNEPGTSHRQGVEVSGDVQATERLSLGLGYTYLDATGPDDVTEVRRPMHKAEGRATLAFLDGRGRVTVSGRYVAGQEDLDFRSPYTPGAQVDLDDYAVVDVAASWRITERVEAFGRVENAFDADYEEIFGYGTRGIAAFAGLRASF